VFESEASRGAQRVVNYLGAMGIAGLVSLDGDLLLSSVKNHAERPARVARLVARAGARREPDLVGRIASLDSPGPCTYYARVGASCVVFVVVDESMTPAAVTDRLARAVAVFDRVMGVPWAAPGGGSGGGPDGALDFAHAPRGAAPRQPRTPKPRA
jgi:hypothetical protein